MEGILEGIAKTIAWMGKLVLFVLFSIIFLPSFLVVNYLQKPWADMMDELFK